MSDSISTSSTSTSTSSTSNDNNMKKEMVVEEEYMQRQFQFRYESLNFLAIKNVQQLQTSDRLWALEWKSALAFSNFLLEQKQWKLNGLKVLEIGAGSGYVGSAFAKVGAEVVMTDRVKSATELSSKNSALNNVRTESYVMDWNHLEQFTQVADHSRDIVVGSDVLYQGRNAIPIVNVLTKYLANGGLGVFFDPGRGYAPNLEQEAKKTFGQNNAELFELFDVKLNHCTMPELHVVLVRNSTTLLPNVQPIYVGLKEFFNSLQNPTTSK